MTFDFGDERPGGPAKVAIGIATALLGVATVGLASSGGADRFLPLIVVVPLYGLFVLWVLLRRRVTMDQGGIVITRTLLGRRWTHRIGFRAVTGVECRGVWMRPRGGSPDEGTPEGDARFIKFDLSLRRGWRRLHLDFLGDAVEAEATARGLAQCIGVPAERRHYVLREDGVPLWRRRARDRLA
ncbi:hypothetical protein AAFN86_19130 [Roseomonas sp. CAU 1739]|uniref:hypothetical protein n=1 Tax=Roseomonas sp. CAU 1739 TaxID=3140364 RepID=UPI00325A7A50